MSADVKRILNGMMEEYIDGVLESNGFKRRKNSFIYSRKIGITKQKIEMISFFHPSYHPGASAHVYPWLTIHFPEISEVAVQMVEEELIDNWKDITIRQPIQIYTNSERWILMDEIGVKSLAEDIEMFISEHTIPLLDDLRCVDDFIKLYEAQDKRLIMDDKRYLYIVSAYILQKDYINAQKVLELRFGKPGLRKRYASAFNYLENIISVSNT